ncbi:MAG: ATP-grasp ribosomal peptide maturase [Corynebacteriales bacterium]|nr:ATP-grasp ribosomal peptide maturase [Mycobacteriales bacterium]
MVVLVLTRQLDPTADLVVEELTRRHVPVVRMNPSELLKRGSFDARIDSAGTWSGELEVERGPLDLADIRSIYYRRPDKIIKPEENSYSEKFAQAEADAAFWGVLSSLPALWLNHPDANRRADNKALQLSVAAQCGLDIPVTAITNKSTSARRFAAERDTVYKAMAKPAGTTTNGHAMAIYTSPVVPNDIDESVTVTTHLFQERIPKSYEIRLTVVGPEAFAARIDAHSAAAALDFRADYASLTYQLVEVPPRTLESVRRLMSEFGLTYGALDFIVTGDQWTFLEVNPNGQWGWIAHETGAPIASAIADLLEDPCLTLSYAAI